jgi:signal transduction histidine kinase/FixJ family two-component response regulator
MAARMRDCDWSRTPLGPVGRWPESLRIAVRIVLGSRYPMFIWWGPELVNLYNDGYVPMLGARHPEALGRSAPVVWADVWPVVGPQTEQVMREGRSTWNDSILLVMERHGFPEETYFTFSYSPAPDDDGGVGGVFCAVFEDTRRVLGERRMRTLRDLGEHSLTAGETVEGACRAAAMALGGDPHDVPFALVYLLEGEGRVARLQDAVGLRPGGAASPVSVPVGTADDVWGFGEVLASGGERLIDGLEERLGRLPAGPWAEDTTRRALVLPIAQAAQERPAGFLVAGVSPRLGFDEDYRSFLVLAAAQVSAAIASARAHEAERRRAESLAELDRAKTAFFSNVSHEFRTPLTLLLGPLAELMALGPSAIDEHGRRLVELANRSAERLLRLVSSLLDFARIEAGRERASYEPTDLATHTAQLASMFRSAVERAGMRLIVDCPPLPEAVYVDRDMWEKVVSNLLSNAFKFTLAGEIAVTLRAEGGKAVLAVRDTGEGIPPGEMPRLFQRFHRIEARRSRSHEGTGIGLALVQELVRLHGGTIEVASALGAGSTFTVSIPFGTAHLPAEHMASGQGAEPTTSAAAAAVVEEALGWLPREAPASPGRAGEGATGAAGGSAYLGHPPEVAASAPDRGAGGRRATVLLADDNADMREYLGRLLASSYHVLAAADGEEALRLARCREVDVVLADVMMPVLDGFGLLAALRADARTASLPVILVSARAGEEAIVEGVAAGADDYIVKPFSARELLARLGAQLAIRRLQERLDRSQRDIAAMFQQMPVPIGVLEGPDLILDMANPAMLELLPGRWVPGSKLEESMPEMADQQFPTLLRRVTSTGVAHEGRETAVQVRRADGVLEQRYFTYLCFPLPAIAGAERVAVVAHEVTDQVRARTELEEGRRRAEESNRAKDDFLAVLAHELRNPLAPLRTGLELLRLADGEPDVHTRALASMERQLGHLLRLVDDLLEVSRVKLGKIELRRERVELAVAVAAALEAQQATVAAAGVELIVDVPQGLVVDGDPVRLAQVVSNLLHNVGMTEDQLAAVFELFVQAPTEGPARPASGSGSPWPAGWRSCTGAR